jgi:TDG/mug DNA glycosylase family protein
MRTLPDYLRRGMRLVIVGCNPGEQSARVGHYYAGRNNVFWTLLHNSGVLPEELTHKDDRRVIEFGVGLTDIVKRPTRTEEEIAREEFAEGRVVLAQKLEQYAPRVVAFNGKNVYEKFSQRKCSLGLQKGRLYGARVFVLPSSSGLHTAGSGVKLRYFKQLARLLKDMKDSPAAHSGENN